jgi:YHS domain-containing protein
MAESADEKKTQIPPQFVTLCGRIFQNTDPQYFPRAQYRGRTIYFCTDSCLGAFLSDPDLFFKMHRNSDKPKQIKHKGHYGHEG